MTRVVFALAVCCAAACATAPVAAPSSSASPEAALPPSSLLQRASADLGCPSVQVLVQQATLISGEQGWAFSCGGDARLYFASDDGWHSRPVVARYP